MASTEIKTLTIGGNSYALNDTTARAGLTAKQDKLTAGSNITISTSNVISATNTTYGAATTSAAGLMSAADKTKLNGIATGANNYTLPAATASTLGGIKVGSGLSVTSDGTLSATGGGSGGVTRDEAVEFKYYTGSVSNDNAAIFNFDDGRGYAILYVQRGTIAFHLMISTVVNTDHYILINNNGNTNDVTVILDAPTISGDTASTVLVPADGITVPAYQFMELSVAAIEGTTAVITASAALTNN